MEEDLKRLARLSDPKVQSELSDWFFSLGICVQSMNRELAMKERRSGRIAGLATELKAIGVEINKIVNENL